MTAGGGMSCLFHKAVQPKSAFTFYLAYLAHPQTERVGLAYAAQRAVLPHEAWDVPLHAVVTEEGCLRPIERRALPVEDLC